MVLKPGGDFLLTWIKWLPKTRAYISRQAVQAMSLPKPVPEPDDARAFPRAACALRGCLALAAMWVLLLVAAGCATAPAVPQGKPPGVRLGPVLDLAKFTTGEDRIQIVSGPADMVHVFIASAALRQVLEIRVRPYGPAEKQVVRSDVMPSSLDAAVDAGGRLHVLMDAEHLVWDGGQWRTADTVWRQTGIQAERPRFVRGNRDLAWTFTALGEQMGVTQGRWVWRASGGGYPAGGFLVYPWFEKARKAVLVADGEGKVRPWNVLDPHSKLDTAILDALFDDAGNVHVIGATGSNIHLLGDTSFLNEIAGRRAGRDIRYFYARVEAGNLRAAGSAAPGAPDQGKEVLQLIDITAQRPLDRPFPLAVDPMTGTVLLADRWLSRAGAWTELKSPSPFGYNPPLRSVSAGNDDFHVIAGGNIDARFAGRAGIQYAMFSKGEWSAPVWLGVAGTASLLQETRVGMARIGNGNAFVAWSTADGFVGRWIERDR